MLSESWSKVDGFTNWDDCDYDIFAKKSEGSVYVAYFCYNTIKVLELADVNDILSIDDPYKALTSIMSVNGEDWEVAILTALEGKNFYAIIDDCDEVTLIGLEEGSNSPVIPKVLSSYEVDTLDPDDYDTELMELYGI